MTGGVEAASAETAPNAAKASGLYTIGSMARMQAEQEVHADALMLDWRGLAAETIRPISSSS
ncbi:hypothetical protein [Rhodopila sp.]|uniref:hypothetical protein n=1 Tax=Rhodopila sp. TaxID=2480087 RepID=UPI003D109E80